MGNIYRCKKCLHNLSISLNVNDKNESAGRLNLGSSNVRTTLIKKD